MKAAQNHLKPFVRDCCCKRGNGNEDQQRNNRYGCVYIGRFTEIREGSACNADDIIWVHYSQNDRMGRTKVVLPEREDMIHAGVTRRWREGSYIAFSLIT